MTTATNEMMGRLRELQGLCRRKKQKLTKSERKEALALLAALFATDEKCYGEALGALVDFPLEIGADALAGSWAALTASGRVVWRDLRGKRFENARGKGLRISLAQRLLASETGAALRLMLEVCRVMRPGKKAIPGGADLRLLRSTLLEPSGAAFCDLPLGQALDSELALLGRYMLAAAFVVQPTRGKEVTPERQLALIEWVNGFPRLEPLPAEVAAPLGKAIRGWDASSRDRLAAKLDLLRTELRQVIEPLLGEGRKGAVAAGGAATGQSPPAAAEAAPDPKPYDPEFEIGRLSEHVRETAERLKSCERALNVSESNAKSIRSELEGSLLQLVEARERVATEREARSDLAAEKRALEKRSEEQDIEIRKLKRQLEAAGKRQEDERAKHKAQLAQLSERLAREGEHRTAGFRHKLGAMVRPYAASLEEARTMGMTLELGEAFRNHMKQLLWLLKKEGVDIDGGQ